MSIIPRKTIFSNPTHTHLRINPVGEEVAFLAPMNDVLNIYLSKTGNLSDGKNLTQEKGHGIVSFFWGQNGQNIFYIKDTNGDENWKIYSINLKTQQSCLVTPKSNVQARLVHQCHTKPNNIIISLNQRNPQIHDLYQLDANTGKLSLFYENPGFVGFIFDHNQTLRFAIKMTPDGGYEVHKAENKNNSYTWKSFLKVSYEDSSNTNILGFNHDSTSVYLLDSRHRDLPDLVELNVSNGKRNIIAQSKIGEITSLHAHPTTKKLHYYVENYQTDKIYFLDKNIEQQFKYLQEKIKSPFVVLDTNLNHTHWIIVTNNDQPPVYFSYNSITNKLQNLGYQYTQFKNIAFGEQSPLIIKTRDSLSMVSYLTLPADIKINYKGETPIPAKPLPLVLLVHGGPQARDDYCFSPMGQWLANRGYAVLQVNYRGSSGFGKEFSNAGNGQWSKKMHDDLIDAVNWSIKNNIADKDKIAIMGGSYGGYASLVGVTFTPKVFACAIDIVGPSNLITLIKTIPPYWEPLKKSLCKRIGATPDSEEGVKFLASCSPLNYVDNIEKPLIIGQGANDPRVKEAESEQIVNALHNKNIPVTYALYPDEGHGFRRPENKQSFWALVESFLKKHLGGKLEPLSQEDFAGSSLKIPKGSELIQGFQESYQNNKSKTN